MIPHMLFFYASNCFPLAEATQGATTGALISDTLTSSHVDKYWLLKTCEAHLLGQGPGTQEADHTILC